MKTINLETGLPTAKQAMDRLTNELYKIRALGVPYAKVIHGYGSTGSGGAIKSELKRHVSVLRQRRLITGFIPGEDFGPFSASGRDAVARFRELRTDIDWGRSNDGISILILK